MPFDDPGVAVALPIDVRKAAQQFLLESSAKDLHARFDRNKQDFEFGRAKHVFSRGRFAFLSFEACVGVC